MSNGNPPLGYEWNETLQKYVPICTGATVIDAEGNTCIDIGTQEGLSQIALNSEKGEDTRTWMEMYNDATDMNSCAVMKLGCEDADDPRTISQRWDDFGAESGQRVETDLGDIGEWIVSAKDDTIETSMKVSQGIIDFQTGNTSLALLVGALLGLEGLEMFYEVGDVLDTIRLGGDQLSISRQTDDESPPNEIVIEEVDDEPVICLNASDRVETNVASSSGVQEFAFEGTPVASMYSPSASYQLEMEEAADSIGGGWMEYSDERLKSDIEDISDGDKIAQLRPVTFVKDGATKAGFIAQDVEKVFPSSVKESKSGMLGTSNTEIIAHLVKQVQALTLEVEALKEG